MHALIGDRVIIDGCELPAALQGVLTQGWRGVVAPRHAARQSHLPTLGSARVCRRKRPIAQTSSRSDKVTHAMLGASAAILSHD
jgi:hypothetical protein